MADDRIAGPIAVDDPHIDGQCSRHSRPGELGGRPVDEVRHDERPRRRRSRGRRRRPRLRLLQRGVLLFELPNLRLGIVSILAQPFAFLRQRRQLLIGRRPGGRQLSGELRRRLRVELLQRRHRILRGLQVCFGGQQLLLGPVTLRLRVRALPLGLVTLRFRLSPRAVGDVSLPHGVERERDRDE